MRIENQYSRYGMKARKASSTSSETFSPDEQSSAEPTERMAAAPSLGALDSILALQSVEDPQLSNRRAVKHGQNLLDVMDELKADMLVGRVSEGRVNRLLSLITRARELSNPDLEEVIADIELRAQVELAKLGH